MNIDVPNLVKAAVPEAEGRNARIISSNGPSYRDRGFLSDDFPHAPPKLYITAETEDFDQVTIAEWRDEGFDVEYLPMGDDGAAYKQTLRELARKDMGPCETFGIIAYGDAAALCLEHYHVMDNNPDHKLGLLVAYYPTAIPDPQGRFPSGIRALVHLAAGEEIGVIRQSQMVGIQGKRRVSRTTIEGGPGTGGKLHLAYQSYTYDADPGFAERDLDEYDGICAELAWTRSVAAARRAFSKYADLEQTMEDNMDGKFFSRSAKQTMGTFVTRQNPSVTHIPTLTGGTGTTELEKFYSRFFNNPPSIRPTLLSRTIGSDRVVDELHVWFKHTHDVPWMLPGIPPTNKRVEVMIVSIVAFRGGKIYHEHVYWDQASVLYQLGLLEPQLGPVTTRKTGVEKLPVVGGEAARRVLMAREGDNEGEADNELIPDWNGTASPGGRERGGKGGGTLESEKKVVKGKDKEVT